MVMVFKTTFSNSFIAGANRSTRRKLLTCHSPLTNFITHHTL